MSESSTESEHSDGPDAAGLTRRHALKRGAMVGGTLLWVTPMVQTVAMSPAFAQATSPGGSGPTTIPTGGGTTPTTGGTTPTTGGTTPTTTTTGGTTTTTGGGTTTTTGGGGGTTPTTQAQVLGADVARPAGGTVAAPGQSALPAPQVLAAADTPPRGVVERLAGTGADLTDLAVLGGLATAAGVAAAALSKRQRPVTAAGPADDDEDGGPTL